MILNSYAEFLGGVAEFHREKQRKNRVKDLTQRNEEGKGAKIKRVKALRFVFAPLFPLLLCVRFLSAALRTTHYWRPHGSDR
jgi:hypothetical protein